MLKKITLIIITIFLLLGFMFIQVNAKQPSTLKTKISSPQLNIKPAWLVIKNNYFYDADTDDLVTAGYGFSALSDIFIENNFVNPNHPTFHELRREKLNRYIDTKSGEGYFFGFNKEKLTPLFDGKVAGTEVQAFFEEGNEKVAFLLQIPLDFDKNQPCIIAIPTMDGEGVYNARDMQIRGLWGLKHNCAVVYNDKGMGNALFDIESKKGYLIDGRVAPQSIANSELLFSPSIISNDDLLLNRYATKRLHSQQNYEAKWGQYVINSIEFAFYYLNHQFSPTNEVVINKNNTRVVVFGVSDGGGAALKAGEYDTKGLIDGIVAVNPQIQVSSNAHYPIFIQHDESEKESLHIKSLIDYTSYASLYMPCAIIALKHNQASKNIPYLDKYYFAGNRCSALKKANLLKTDTEFEQAKEALDKLYQYGWTHEMANQMPYHYFNQSINLPYQYISAYGRYGINDHLCHYSVASIDQTILYNEGKVHELNESGFPLLWIKNSGSLPIRQNDDIIAIDLVNDDDPQNSHREFYSRSKNSSIIDYNLAGAICLRDSISEKRVLAGQTEIFATAKLNQIKTIIVHGQLNIKNLPNYSSRAYVALNSYVDGSFSNLVYIEVENASYFNGDSPFDNKLIPIDFYGERAIDMLWDNLVNGTSLPDSQVIRTRVREGQVGLAPMINRSNLTPIFLSPKQENRIFISNGTMILPN